MKKHSPLATIASLGLAALALLLSSCAGPNYVAMDHTSYTKMPDCPSSKFWRGLAESNPWTAKAAFHGNWGGSGNRGGKPVDMMDEGFWRHDVVYYESRCGKHLRAADRELVTWLEALDEDSLNPEQSKYRKRAIKFMTSPLANFIGKPPAVMLRKHERDGCCFASVEDIKAFFDPESPGFPNAPAMAEEPAVVEKPAEGEEPVFPLLAETP